MRSLHVAVALAAVFASCVASAQENREERYFPNLQLTEDFNFDGVPVVSDDNGKVPAGSLIVSVKRTIDKSYEYPNEDFYSLGMDLAYFSDDQVDVLFQDPKTKKKTTVRETVNLEPLFGDHYDAMVAARAKKRSAKKMYGKMSSEIADMGNEKWYKYLNDLPAMQSTSHGDPNDAYVVAVADRFDELTKKLPAKDRKMLQANMDRTKQLLADSVAYTEETGNIGSMQIELRRGGIEDLYDNYNNASRYLIGGSKNAALLKTRDNRNPDHMLAQDLKWLKGYLPKHKEDLSYGTVAEARKDYQSIVQQCRKFKASLPADRRLQKLFTYVLADNIKGDCLLGINP